MFNKESEFEEAVIDRLKISNWDGGLLKNPTEEDLIENWKKIIFENNRGIDRLNDEPLTDGEMDQILEKIIELRTPLRLNALINGKTIQIVRDNENDEHHFGKEISLKIFDKYEVSGGQSRYQIAQQPVLKSGEEILNDGRADLMLLFYGMPLIHIELKRSGIPVSKAYNQIEKYADYGMFKGIFSLIQIFVAMTPEETVYFANPGPEGKFNKKFYFHWADFNNEPINNWSKVVSTLLSIPQAHKMVGMYTVADEADGVLKVMRSYQYHAANAIVDKVATTIWKEDNQKGGYIWHTTGSGKTMTSFKCAQLIAQSKDADKVIFLMDRIELGTQSLYEYRAFAEADEEVQATNSARDLIKKLKSNNPKDTLIVTSIQKMSRIKGDEFERNKSDLDIINNKRIVIIVDEAHRSTFGEMLSTIKDTFPYAIFFGFTGTPIYDENMKNKSTTSTIFGNELHRYTIADGIRDENVLGFDLYKILTYKEKDIKEAVALEKSRSKTVEEALSDPERRKCYLKYLNDISMVGYYDKSGHYVNGIEDYIPKSQYNNDKHREIVVEDISSSWRNLSLQGKFCAIFATSSIVEAIKYYRLMKEKTPNIKVTALFDPSIDNNGNEEDLGDKFKKDGIVEILKDYNERYDQNFTMATHDLFKKDVSSRMSHKKPYEFINKNKEKQIDILIVVDQMLTGFDSKWLNTLYLDKVLKYENVIQAFSRTNRILDEEKRFGTIRYYRYPNTMEKNIEEAIKFYSGDRPVDLFVERLPKNLIKLNEIAREITDLFEENNIFNFEKLPEDDLEKGKFAQLFQSFNEYLIASKVQGFRWNKDKYVFNDPYDVNSLSSDHIDYTDASQQDYLEITVEVKEETYLIWVQRYKELERRKITGDDELPFNIEGYLIEIETGKINLEYIESNFRKYLRDIEQDEIDPEQLDKTLNELHKSFASLTQEEQKYANVFLHDIERGNIKLVPDKIFMDYIKEYKVKTENQQINDLHDAIGVDIEKLKKIMELGLNEKNIDEYGRLKEIEATIDAEKAKNFFEKQEGKTLSVFDISRDASNLLRNFILKGGFNIDID